MQRLKAALGVVTAKIMARNGFIYLIRQEPVQKNDANTDEAHGDCEYQCLLMCITKRHGKNCTNCKVRSQNWSNEMKDSSNSGTQGSWKIETVGYYEVNIQVLRPPAGTEISSVVNATSRTRPSFRASITCGFLILAF